MFWPELTFPPVNLWSVWRMQRMESPCRGKCEYSVERDLCTNCGRTMGDISTWTTLTKKQRRSRIIEAQSQLKQLNEMRKL